jgi:xylulokinase
MSELLLGIDVGTYSSKGVLVDSGGKVLKTFVVEHGMDIPRAGWAEQDADKVWWADVISICQDLLDGSPYTGEDVASVCLSAIGPCVLPLDSAGRPLRPGILYGVDTRAKHEIDYLNQKIGTGPIFDLSGMSLSSQAAGPKILWIKNNEPEIWKNIELITTASSYLIYKLTGEKVIDRHTASHFMPLFDIQKLEWSSRYSHEIIDLDKLPRLAWSDELAGYICRKGAEKTGLKPGTPVAVGAVDALSEGISVGATQPGDLMIMYGSTTFFILVLNKPVPDDKMWTVAGAYEHQYNLAAGMATTGSLTRWFRDLIIYEDPDISGYDDLFNEISKVSAGSDGLLVLPYFSGERTPVNDPQARGVVAGLTLSHSRGHVFRAILEGVAFGIRHNIDAFADNGAEVKRVIAVGGGTKSTDWLRIVSSAADIVQIVPEITIGASYGDAFLAGCVAGLLKKEDIHNWVKYKETIMPADKEKEIYSNLFPLYLELYQKNKDILHRLASLSNNSIQ